MRDAKETLAEENGRTTSWGQEAHDRKAFHTQDFTWPSFPQGFFLQFFLQFFFIVLVKEGLLIA